MYFFQTDDDMEVKPGSVNEHVDGGTGDERMSSGDIDVAMDVEVVAEVRWGLKCTHLGNYLELGYES